MVVDDLRWMWKISASICKHERSRTRKFGFGAVFLLRRRLYYIAKSLRLISSLQVFIHPRNGSPLQRIMEQRPELVGATIWPYICSSWSAKTSLQKIDEHFRVIEKFGPRLDFPVNGKLPLIDLADVAINLRLVLDQPKWFMRDGLFALNLFLMDDRIYSLVFSFGFEEGKVVAYIGGLQGVDVDGILSHYKNLTKLSHGMRPRDFLVELFRSFCRCMGVTKIYAVNDAKRQHRSSYFGSEKSGELLLDYNDIWIERGAVWNDDEFFVLSLETPMKSLDDVPSKKRAMYRRRYELLQSIEKQMQVSLGFKTNSDEC